MRILIVAAALLMASGCYHYAPGGMPPTAGTAEIRIVLERDWATRHAVGDWSRSGTPYLSGTLVGESAEELEIVPRPEAGMAAHPQWRGGSDNVVSVPRARIVVVEQKRFDRRRTTMMVAGATLLGGVFAVARMSADPGERDSRPPSPIPDAARLPAPR